ncbi:MAG: cyclic nucleotide-binding domain-containing protein, partial [Lachnospiraceae bacterium]|nr:cyclic nucleotide-binding domain-containing protein [Lachnospiraceae bacterium]
MEDENQTPSIILVEDPEIFLHPTMQKTSGDILYRLSKKNQVILAEGDAADRIGVVLLGGVQIVRVDYYGNRSILTELQPGQMFGESFACADVSEIPVNVVATESSEVLLIEAKRILHICSSVCGFHNRLIYNLMKLVATKNLVFNQKLEIISKRTTREKLMTYLVLQAKQQGNNCFTVLFDRQELADYLEVDRSGLSSEISKLRKEGILECKKNRFTLLRQDN